MMYVLKTDAAPSLYNLDPNEEATLELLYSVIGTDTIEVAYEDGVYQIVADENGIAKGLAPNVRATAWWYLVAGFEGAASQFLLSNATMGNVLVGTVVVLTRGNCLK